MIEVKDFDTIGKPGLSREIDILFNFPFYLLKNEVGKTVDALPMCTVPIYYLAKPHPRERTQSIVMVRE